MLKRVVNWNGDGFTWETDPRLTEKLIYMLNLSGREGSVNPGGKDIGKHDRDIDCELEYSDAKLVQAAAGLEQYIALDRPDIAYSVKTALQQMAKPTKLVQLRGVRVARYLKNNPRLVWKYPYQQQPKSIDLLVDADFAARETMLRSTSSFAEYYGESANRVRVQHAERAGFVHGRVRVLRHHEGLGAQLAQPGHHDRLRGDGGGRYPTGRKRRRWDRITHP